MSLPARHPAAEEAEGLLQQARRRRSAGFLHRALHRRVGARLDVEAQLAGEAHRAQDAHRVLAHADLGVADGADQPRVQVAPAADVVDHPALGDVVEQAVDGEVAAARVLLGGAEDVVVGDEQIVLAVAVLAGPRGSLELAVGLARKVETSMIFPPLK